MQTEELMLPETQIYLVKRVEDLALIGVEYTRRTANILLNAYEKEFDEECYIAPNYINRSETIQQRNENNQ